MRPPAVPLADKRKAPTAEQVQRRREEEEAVSVSLRKLEKKLDPRGAGGDRGDRGYSSSEEEMELDLDALRKQTMQRLGAGGGAGGRRV